MPSKTTTKPASTKAKTWGMNQRVAFTTHLGRSGKGEIVGIASTARGAFYSVREASGDITKLRSSQLKSAR